MRSRAATRDSVRFNIMRREVGLVRICIISCNASSSEVARATLKALGHCQVRPYRRVLSAVERYEPPCCPRAESLSRILSDSY
jgi:hypothetical protein